jgi:glycosyltransferase involved in cell wall biosynthesis
MNLSIIIPAHNEEESIAEVIRHIEEKVSVAHEIVVVNDHSTDRTADIIADLARSYKNDIRLVENTDKPGFANALKTGFYHARANIIVPVMADLCDDPDTINRMYEKALEGFDIVCGSRYAEGGKKVGGPRLKTFFSRFFGVSLNRLIGIPTRDLSNSFKLYKKEIIEKADPEAKGFEISVEIPLKAFFLGYKITEIPTIWVNRKEGESKFKVFKQGPLYLKLYLWAICRKIFKK